MAPLFKPAVVAALLMSTALGSPLSAPTFAGGKGSVQTTPTVKTFNAPLLHKQALQKYGEPVPDALEEAITHYAEKISNNRKRASGSAEVTMLDTVAAYVIEVSIGTPPLKLTMLPDTGSDQGWVFSVFVPEDQLNGETLYAPNKSSTSKQVPDETFEISYGDGGEVSGVVYTDVMTIAGITSKNQGISVANYVDDPYILEAPENCGVLGLSKTTEDNYELNEPTFWNNVKPTLDAPVFTTGVAADGTGKIDFGFIDETSYEGDITYADVIENDLGYWAFTVDGYAVGDGTSGSLDIPLVADTGTTLIYAPTEVVEAYYKQVDGAKQDPGSNNFWLFPCDAKLPDLTFTFGEGKIVIPGEDINTSPGADYSEGCVGTLQDNGGRINLLGYMGMRSQFVVWEDDESKGGRRIGFAKLVTSAPAN